MTTTPAEAWQRLREGNERFRAGDSVHPHQTAERRANIATGQEPFATVVACSDSREPIEILFDQGLGDLFVVRNAGQMPSDSVLGSVEFGVGVLHTPLLVVLGHQHCGAVRAAIDRYDPDTAAPPPAIARLIEPIDAAVRTIAGGSDVDSATLDAAAVGAEHVRRTVKTLLESSEMIAGGVADGSLAVVGATYLLDEGRVVADVTLGLD